jgi:predicted nucleic acid-binding protein
MIVVDVNVIAYFSIPGQRTGPAVSVYEIDSRWIAPELWKSEMLSVLATQIRAGLMQIDRAIEVIEAIPELLTAPDARPAPSEVLRLSSSSGCSSYDCEYVALAQTLRVPLVTEDQKVLRAFPGVAVSMEQFVQRNT